jgi:hypothetical protein
MQEEEVPMETRAALADQEEVGLVRLVDMAHLLVQVQQTQVAEVVAGVRALQAAQAGLV